MDWVPRVENVLSKVHHVNREAHEPQTPPLCLGNSVYKSRPSQVREAKPAGSIMAPRKRAVAAPIKHRQVTLACEITADPDSIDVSHVFPNDCVIGSWGREPVVASPGLFNEQVVAQQCRLNGHFVHFWASWNLVEDQTLQHDVLAVPEDVVELLRARCEGAEIRQVEEDGLASSDDLLIFGTSEGNAVINDRIHDHSDELGREVENAWHGD